MHDLHKLASLRSLSGSTESTEWRWDIAMGVHCGEKSSELFKHHKSSAGLAQGGPGVVVSSISGWRSGFHSIIRCFLGRRQPPRLPVSLQMTWSCAGSCKRLDLLIQNWCPNHRCVYVLFTFGDKSKQNMYSSVTGLVNFLGFKKNF